MPTSPHNVALGTDANAATNPEATGDLDLDLDTPDVYQVQNTQLHVTAEQKIAAEGAAKIAKAGHLQNLEEIPEKTEENRQNSDGDIPLPSSPTSPSLDNCRGETTFQNPKPTKYEKFEFAGNREALYLPPSFPNDNVLAAIKEIFKKIENVENKTEIEKERIQKDILFHYLYGKNPDKESSKIATLLETFLPNDEDVQKGLSLITKGSKDLIQSGIELEGITSAVKGPDEKWSILTSGTADIDVCQGNSTEVVAKLREGEPEITDDNYIKGLYLASKSNDVEFLYNISVKNTKILDNENNEEKANALIACYKHIDKKRRDKKEIDNETLTKESLSIITRCKTDNKEIDVNIDVNFENLLKEYTNEEDIGKLKENIEKIIEYNKTVEETYSLKIEHKSEILGAKYKCSAGYGSIRLTEGKETSFPRLKANDFLIFLNNGNVIRDIKNGNLDALLKEASAKSQKAITLTIARGEDLIKGVILEPIIKNHRPFTCTKDPSQHQFLKKFEYKKSDCGNGAIVSKLISNKLIDSDTLKVDDNVYFYYGDNLLNNSNNHNLIDLITEEYEKNPGKLFKIISYQGENPAFCFEYNIEKKENLHAHLSSIIDADRSPIKNFPHFSHKPIRNEHVLCLEDDGSTINIMFKVNEGRQSLTITNITNNSDRKDINLMKGDIIFIDHEGKHLSDIDDKKPNKFIEEIIAKSTEKNISLVASRGGEKSETLPLYAESDSNNRKTIFRITPKPFVATGEEIDLDHIIGAKVKPDSEGKGLVITKITNPSIIKSIELKEGDNLIIKRKDNEIQGINKENIGIIIKNCITESNDQKISFIVLREKKKIGQIPSHVIFDENNGLIYIHPLSQEDIRTCHSGILRMSYKRDFSRGGLIAIAPEADVYGAKSPPPSDENLIKDGDLLKISYDGIPIDINKIANIDEHLKSLIEKDKEKILNKERTISITSERSEKEVYDFKLETTATESGTITTQLTPGKKRSLNHLGKPFEKFGENLRSAFFKIDHFYDKNGVGMYIQKTNEKDDPNFKEGDYVIATYKNQKIIGPEEKKSLIEIITEAFDPESEENFKFEIHRESTHVGTVEYKGEYKENQAGPPKLVIKPVVPPSAHRNNLLHR